ncbi:hypothetical protein GALL_378360 [mine drainage metagenome]|uniref:Uncharacterized protein n=1 Tax=mine drainage metagenome TaxID=410659 RepID=A0A1J5QB36_9ZZZZ
MVIAGMTHGQTSATQVIRANAEKTAKDAADKERKHLPTGNDGY